MATRPDRWLGFTLRVHVAAGAVFAAVTLLFFFPLLRGDTFSEVGLRQEHAYPWASLTPEGEPPPLVVHYDQADLFYPWQVFANRELQRGDLPFWDPHAFGGHPLLANASNGFLYPPKLLLELTVSPARTHDLLAASHLFLAGLAMFLLLGGMRLGFAAALVGALAWMLNSFALSWQALDHYVAIAVWLPIAVLLVHVTVRRRSFGAALGLAAVLALSFLGANVLFFALVLLALAGYAITLAAVEAARDRSSLPGTLARLAAAAVLSAGVTALVSIPTLALAGEQARVTLSHDELEQFALPLSGLLNVFYPHDIAPQEPYNRDLFAGTAVALLALVGLLRRHVLALFSAALGLLAILFMLHTPVTLVFAQTVPGLDNFKPLARAAFLLQFALAVLAAFGLQSLLRLGLRTRAAAVVVVAVAGSIVVQEYDLARFLMRHQPHESASLYPRTPIVDYLSTRGERFIAVSRILHGATPMVHSLDNSGGYESLLPRRVQDFWRVVGDRVPPGQIDALPLIYAYDPEYEVSKLDPQLLARAGVAHVVVRADVPRSSLPAGLVLGYEGPDGLVYTVPRALPRAYVAGGCVEVATGREALERFVSGDVDTAGTVILEGRHGCDGSSRRGVGSATVVEREPSSLGVRVQTERDAWLVVTDTWDGGWRANVDGDAADVLLANSTQRAVAVPAGTHLVRFRYEPVHFRFAAAIAAASLAVMLGALGWLVVRRRRRRGARAPATPR